MNRKKILSAILTLILLPACLCACQAAESPQAPGSEPASEQVVPATGAEEARTVQGGEDSAGDFSLKEDIIQRKLSENLTLRTIRSF